MTQYNHAFSVDSDGPTDECVTQEILPGQANHRYWAAD